MRIKAKCVKTEDYAMLTEPSLFISRGARFNFFRDMEQMEAGKPGILYGELRLGDLEGDQPFHVGQYYEIEIKEFHENAIEKRSQ